MASPSTPFLGIEMSGLSYPEREGCRKLLGLLENEEIMALCDTITNRLVQPEDRQGKGRPLPEGGRPSAGLGGPGSGGRERRACEASPPARPAEPPGISAAAAAQRPWSRRAAPGGCGTEDGAAFTH